MTDTNFTKAEACIDAETWHNDVSAKHAHEYLARLYDNRHMVAEYIARGWAPTPVKSGGAEPLLPDWQTTRMGVDDIDRHFPRGGWTNIGVLLGEPSGGLVDVSSMATVSRPASQSSRARIEPVQPRPIMTASL